MGWPDKIEEKKQENVAKNESFPLIYFAEIFREFSVRLFLRSENGKRRRKIVSTYFNIKIQHRTRIQSRMPTRWSCKSKQFTYASSDKDLEKNGFLLQLTALHPSSQKRFPSIEKRLIRLTFERRY